MPESGLLDEIVLRIVEVAVPDSIILFGSAGRGGWSPDSDIDLMVVKSDVEHRGCMAEEICVGFIGVLAAVDIVVETPKDIESCRDEIGTVMNPALAEGKTIYAAGPACLDRSEQVDAACIQYPCAAPAEGSCLKRSRGC